MIMIQDNIDLLLIRQGHIQQTSCQQWNNIKTLISSKNFPKDNKSMILLKELKILLRDNNKYQLLYFKDNRLNTTLLILKYLNNFQRLKFHFKDHYHPLLNFQHNLFHNSLIYNHNLQIFNINKDHKYINSMI